MPKENAVSKAILFIENNLYEPITASDISSFVSYSYYHFHRYFFSITGETIGSYIRNRRLALAAWQLVYSKNRVLEISTSLNFESAESFSRAFKLRYGISPMQYRENGICTTLATRKSSKNISTPSLLSIEPEIISFAAVQLIGMRFQTKVTNGESSALWGNFKEHYPANHNLGIRYEVFENETICQQNTFTIEQPTSVFLGIAAEKEEIPRTTKLTHKIIPAGKYAKFIHMGLAQNILSSYEYIWGVWFPKSHCKIGSGEDFEVYTDRFLGIDNEQSQIDIYFPIE